MASSVLYAPLASGSVCVDDVAAAYIMMPFRSYIFKELNDVTDSMIFGEDFIDADEIMAWQIASMGAMHVDALGVYAPNSNNISQYLCLMKVLG